jgi:UDP-N-acetylmuramoyl-tripeptide--D-alanyl-D-alanine ligase
MEISTSPDGVIVVNDAYNANPDSMAVALKALAELGRRRQGRTIAVLGEMKELGPESVTAHDEIGRLAVRLNIGHLIAVGAGARPIQLGAAHEGSWNGEAVFAADIEEAMEALHAVVQPGDIVLVKASRGVALEQVAQRLGAGT